MRRTPLRRGSGLTRRTPLRPVSPKRENLARVRRELAKVVELGDQRCQAGPELADAVRRLEGLELEGAEHEPDAIIAACARFADDLHEPFTRARGGNPGLLREVLAVCRACHDWIHAHPMLASQARDEFGNHRWLRTR
jgi:hypothetical protein